MNSEPPYVGSYFFNGLLGGKQLGSHLDIGQLAYAIDLFLLDLAPL